MEEENKENINFLSDLLKTRVEFLIPILLIIYFILINSFFSIYN
jgi:TRAP-type uncharacterized transport system fused permease subunit